MAVSKTTARVLGLLLFLACAAVAGVGVWYWRGGGLEEADDTADDEDDTVDSPADAGARPHAKKGGGFHFFRRKKKGAAHRPPPAAPAPPPGPAGPSGLSYEAAIAANNQHLAPGTKDAPDLSDAQLSGPMRSGAFLDACGVPSTTKVTVKVAIRGGHAVGVSVYLTPPSAPAAGCVERHVRGLAWPSSAKMDSFVTSY